MGTRSLVRFFDDGKELVTIYQQFDGYPSGVGKELAAFLQSGKQVNGLTMKKNPPRKFNGMGCMAAQFIAQFKTEAGGLYIQKPGAKDCGEDFTYEVRGGFDRNPLRVTVKTDAKIFDGNVSDFAAWCMKEQDD